MVVESVLPVVVAEVQMFGARLDAGVAIAAANVLIAVFAGANFGARGEKGEGKKRRMGGLAIKGMIGILALAVAGLGITEAHEQELRRRDADEFRTQVSGALADLLLHVSGTADLGEGTRSLDAIVESLPDEMRAEVAKLQPVLTVALPNLNAPPRNNDGAQGNAGSSGSAVNNGNGSASNNGRGNAGSFAFANSMSLEERDNATAAMRWYKKAHPREYNALIREYDAGNAEALKKMIASYEEYLESSDSDDDNFDGGTRGMDLGDGDLDDGRPPDRDEPDSDNDGPGRSENAPGRENNPGDDNG